MPDVLIRMEMPQSCDRCFVKPCKFRALEKRITVQRHPDCPLHELPPHGDLISKQTVLAALYSDYAYAAMDIIEKEVPVVVPAERREG